MANDAMLLHLVGHGIDICQERPQPKPGPVYGESRPSTCPGCSRRPPGLGGYGWPWAVRGGCGRLSL